MKSSSVRGFLAGSSLKINGWLGTMRSSVTTAPVYSAMAVIMGSTVVRGRPSLAPPVIMRKPMLDLISLGLTMVTQCFHWPRFMSFSFHVWEVMSRT